MSPSVTCAEASWPVLVFLVLQSANKTKQTLEGPTKYLEAEELRGNPKILSLPLSVSPLPSHQGVLFLLELVSWLLPRLSVQHVGIVLNQDSKFFGSLSFIEI